jgi:CheY-like chemotaxis protein
LSLFIINKERREQQLVCQQPNVLIVDDEEPICDLLNEELTERGFICKTALDANTALSRLMTHHFDVVLLDIRLPEISGMDLLQTIHSEYCDVSVIMVTAINEADTAVQAIKSGAWDYVIKPFNLDRIETSIRAALGAGEGGMPASDVRPLHNAKQCNHATEEFPEIDAIAHGVEARYNNLISWSGIITEETANIAIGLGIPEERVHKWVEMRTSLDSQGRRAIETLLTKLERSPLAQAILSIAELPCGQMPGHRSN